MSPGTIIVEPLGPVNCPSAAGRAPWHPGDISFESTVAFPLVKYGSSARRIVKVKMRDKNIYSMFKDFDM